MKKLWLSLLCGALTLWMLLLSSCQFIPSIEETESETESETEAETVPVFEGANTVFVLYVRDGEKANVTVQITGDVCLAGMEGSLRLPAGATVAELKAGNHVITAAEGGEIAWALLSQTGENITGETVLFTFVTEWSEASPAVTVSDAFDRDFKTVEYAVEFYAFGK